jgi:hypothetical protein
LLNAFKNEARGDLWIALTFVVSSSLKGDPGQAKAAQEKAASTSDWNASKATNVQPVVDAIEVDYDESVVAGKGRKKRLRRLGEEVDSEEEKKKQRLERIAKINEMWDEKKAEEKEEEERKKKEREEKRKSIGIS